MTALSLDTEQARATGSALIRDGDSAYGVALDLRDLFVEFHLELLGMTARLAIEAGAAELWGAGTFLHLLADRVETTDHLDADDVADGLILAAGLVGRHGTIGRLQPSWFGISPPDGDLRGTFDRELRSPYTVFGPSDVERTRALLLRALTDTSDARQIRNDEFEIVDLGGGQYVVVLPGVTDLSSVDPFLSDSHRSVRDLDQFAVESSRSTSVDKNRYAAMVWEGMVAAGVPAGADVMIVGHSFGADTALDLAADAHFNGPGGFAVTHVVAAGYYSQPQLGHVPDSTEVLVLQNHRDAAVIVESAGHSNAWDTVTSGATTYERLTSGDLFGAVASGWDSIGSGLKTVVDAGGYLVDHRDDLADVAGGLVTSDPDRTWSGLDGLVTMDPRTVRLDDHVIVDVFEGGSAGAGHHPSNYVAHLDTTDSEIVTGFLASAAAAGYSRGGSAVAVDISVP